MTNKSLIGLLHWVYCFFELKIENKWFSLFLRHIFDIILYIHIHLQIWQTIYGAMDITLLSCINILLHAVTVYWELKIYAKIKIIVIKYRHPIFRLQIHHKCFIQKIVLKNMPNLVAKSLIYLKEICCFLFSMSLPKLINFAWQKNESTSDAQSKSIWWKKYKRKEKKKFNIAVENAFRFLQKFSYYSVFGFLFIIEFLLHVTFCTMFMTLLAFRELKCT